MGLGSLIGNFLTQFYTELRRTIIAHKKAVLYIIGIAAVVLLVSLVLMYKAIERPWFCGSCHNMDPYIASWKQSKHRMVVCVDCHYKPGLINHLKGKFTDGQLSLVYFITGKGPSAPHAEISDESCTQCHKVKDISAKVIDFKGVYFSHQHHLGPLRNGMQLRCTSCHSQIVQGEHLTVTESVCFQCHFYKTAENDPQRQCRTCHKQVKQVLQVNGVEFKHGDYIARGLDCSACHKYVVSGDGHVPPEKCVQCHNQREILETKYSHRSLHLNHVTNHKVECYVCHQPFQHRIVQETVGNPQACDKCHSDNQHSAQQELYFGKGGIGVDGTPFRMYQSHIDCTGCHSRKGSDRGSAGSTGFDFKAIEAGCVECHGKGFDQMLENWTRVLAKAQSQTEGWLQRAEAAVGKGASGEKGRRAKTLLGEARFNYSFVKMAHGIHNIEYALKLLNVSDKKAAEAISLSTGQKLAVGDIKMGCAEMCHSYIKQNKVKLVDATFSHGVHVGDLGLDCLECHSPRWDHGKTVMKNCNQCHHGQNPVNCVNCHKTETDLYTGVGGEALPATPSFKIAADVKCKDCHAEVDQGKVSNLASIKAKCVGCHDDKIVAKLDAWKKSGETMMNGVPEKLAKARELLGRAERAGINVDQFEKRVSVAEKNIELVRKGNVVHNVKFSEMLVKQAVQYLDDVIARLNSKLYG